MVRRRTTLEIGLMLTLLGVVTFAAFWAAGEVSENQWLRNIITDTGVAGIVFLAFISGLNAFVPVPPATFAPLFLEAGFTHATIIACFVIGTLAADSVGYLIGWYGKDFAHRTFPSFVTKLTTFLAEHTRLVLPIATIYFSIAPLPNELIIIPLALSGYPLSRLIIPLVIGNVIHHTILVYGYEAVFQALF